MKTGGGGGGEKQRLIPIRGNQMSNLRLKVDHERAAGLRFKGEDPVDRNWSLGLEDLGELV